VLGAINELTAAMAIFTINPLRLLLLLPMRRLATKKEKFNTIKI
jgi:hypothetical protein